MASDGTTWKSVPNIFWAMVPPRLGGDTTGSNVSSGGITPAQWWYCPVISVAVVLPSNSGGTVSIPNSRNMTLFGSNLEAIGPYKNPTLFYMKGHKSIGLILKS